MPKLLPTTVLAWTAMLLRFSAANHLSLRTRQELSLIASTLKDNEAGLIDCAGISEQALPVAVIYGANASGKSNIVGAFRFLLSAVRESHNNWAPDAGVPRHPFGLDPACSRSHSSFDVDFVLEGVRYHYGFDATEKEFTAEWLDAYPAGRRQVLFRRTGQAFDFGRVLKGRNKIISDLTRPNSLFLSAARQNDHEELTKLSKFLARSAVHTADFWDVQARHQAPDEYMSKIVAFLNESGTGVVGYRYKETSLPDEAQELIAAIFSTLEKRRPEGAPPLPTDFRSHTSLELSHKAVNGEVIYFDLERESMGTRRLLALLAPAFRALSRGSVLVVDELDASLHTKACEAVLALFSSRTSNPKGAQIIATTHDTNILRSPLLRRDEIWFTEKDAEGATDLYPLSDFHTRQSDNIAKGYLQGRYGAIPFAGSGADLIDRL